MNDEYCTGCEVAVEVPRGEDSSIYCSVLLESEPQSIFKEKYCPCRKCVVRAVCRARKANVFTCSLFSERISEFLSEIKEG